MTMCDKHQFYDRVNNRPCEECLKELGEYDSLPLSKCEDFLVFDDENYGVIALDKKKDA